MFGSSRIPQNQLGCVGRFLLNESKVVKKLLSDTDTFWVYSFGEEV